MSDEYRQPLRLPRDCTVGHEYLEEDCESCREVVEELRELFRDKTTEKLEAATDALEIHGRRMEVAAIAAEASGGCFNCELHRDGYRLMTPILAHLDDYRQWLAMQGPVILPESMGNVIKAFEDYCKRFEVPKVEHLDKAIDPQERESKED